MMIHQATTILSFLLFTKVCHADHGLVTADDEKKLPKPLSDLTATVSPYNDLVYLAGGCDHPEGNKYLDDDGIFVCMSLSQSLYSFDPKTNEIKTWKEMPRTRYRHGAAAVNNQIWLIGGRDETDAHINAIDVYDIETDTWSTPGVLPPAYNTSDNACVSDGNFVYTLGGYDIDYNAMNTVFRIDPNNIQVSNGEVQVEEVEPMLEPRGDIQAVTSTNDDGETLVYVTGGFTHDNKFCEALKTVEVFNFEKSTDGWTQAPSLNEGRADKGLAALNGQIYALGGESLTDNICDISDEARNEIVLWQQTVAVDDVEVLDGDKWTVLASLEDHRFRFAAVGFDDTNTFYTFGGQLAYDDNCKCYRASDQIIIYEHGDDHSGAAVFSTTTSVMTISALMVMAELFQMF
mmetsp:Transcript_11905/g.16900  ORF Transcript_11905/g.16900 Transcript_11905/m.16900 type:complete len:404 (+) Transcript_11905:248-1459(+)